MLHKAIKGFEDYLISDTGQVYSLKTGKYLKARKTPNGYYQVALCKNNVPKCVSVHRLVAQAFIPNPNNKPEVDHINRVKEDNQVENLRWSTRKEQIENRDLTDYKNKHRKARGVPIIELVDDKEVEYLSLTAVPDISNQLLRYHIAKSKTGFYAKGRNFIVPQQK